MSNNSDIQELIKYGYNIKIKHFKNGLKKVTMFNTSIRLQNKPTSIIKSKEWYSTERSLYKNINATKQKIFDIANNNSWDYFLTLTFNPEKVDRYNYQECKKKAVKWLKNAKYNYSKDLQYILVVDLHEDGAFHFHGLLKNIGNLKLKDSTKKDKKGRTIYHCNFSSGFNSLTKISDTKRASSYLTNYMTKNSFKNKQLFNQKKFFYSQGLDKPVLILKHLEEQEFLDQKKELDKSSVFSKNNDYSSSFLIDTNIDTGISTR